LPISRPFDASKKAAMKFMHLKQNIFARRYFYPLISEFQMYRQFATDDARNLPGVVDFARHSLTGAIPA
jgi:hypothetical protein